MRASMVAEKEGIPSVSLIASGFVQQAKAVAKAFGVDNLPVAEYPGVIMVDSEEELRRKVEEVLIDRIIEELTKPVEPPPKPVEPEPRDIIFRGALAEVQRFFYTKLWSDGLPIIPPTIDKVKEFLKFTDRSPDDVIGRLLPENREATAWNVAVNGVMAGCLPEYMPILIAVVEVIADPEFRIQDAGSTPGWEPLIILNGPIIKELDFNYGSGVMRIGRQANSSIGRFLRLYMRNVAGLRIPPGATDKGTISYTFNVVLAENEDAVAEIGWEPFSVDRGFKAGENVATVLSIISISPPCYSAGATALEHLETIAEVIAQRSMDYWSGPAAHKGKFFPVFLLSPSVAGIIARDGWTKDDIRRYLYENVKAPAGWMEKLAWQAGLTSFSFCSSVKDGLISEVFCQSNDPDRMLPVFLRPDWIGIVVSGDPGRNQSRGYVQNQQQGVPITKRIVLPKAWEGMMRNIVEERSKSGF